MEAIIIAAIICGSFITITTIITGGFLLASEQYNQTKRVRLEHERERFKMEAAQTEKLLGS